MPVAMSAPDSPTETARTPATPEDLFARLEALGIQVTTQRHDPVFTVEEAKALRGALPGGHSKNLFVRNKKGRMWLVVAEEDREIDLKTLGEKIGAGRLSFGSADRLMSHLGVVPGAVTPFALINDREGQVQPVLDAEMMRHEVLNFHPLDNAMTTAIARQDLVRFIEACGHSPEIVDLS
jgi:Ala-tRNA(Pro) deacylase